MRATASSLTPSPRRSTVETETTDWPEAPGRDGARRQRQTLSGGNGDDTLAGGNGAEKLLGGNGNDSIDGNRGNDVASMGNGDDTFIWDPGDGSDTVEGQNGNDTMLFNGAAVAEHVDLTANGNRLKFFRDVANITMDTAGVERVDFNALGGEDVVTVDDLTGTDVNEVNVDLAGTLGGIAGDGAADRVIVKATDGNDAIDVSGDAGGVKVSGLVPTVRVSHSGGRERPARDQHPRRQRHRGLGRLGRRCAQALRGRRARPLRKSRPARRGVPSRGGPAETAAGELASLPSTQDSTATIDPPSQKGTLMNHKITAHSLEQARRSSPMTDKATRPARAVANECGRLPATDERVSAPARELAQRRSAADEVLLLWHPDTDRVELSVRDLATGANLRIEIAPGNAIDAFHHPYAYAATRDLSPRVGRDDTTIVDD